MADGTNNMPDQSQALLALKQYTDQQSAGKCAPLLCLVPGGGRDVQLTNLKNPGIFGADNMVCKYPQGKPGLIEALKQQLGLKGGQLFDDIKKCGQNVASMYSGDLPNGSLPGAPSGGGSFADNLGPRGGGGIDIG